jgi:hypothetical protein
MLRIKDSNNFGEALGLTESQEMSIRLSILRKLMEKNSSFSAIINEVLTDLSEHTQPTLEIISVVSFYSGIYNGKVHCERGIELVQERHYLELMLG